MINLEENKLYFYLNKNNLIENFNNYNRLGNVYYPLKTNSNEIIIKELKSLDNSNFLISSIYHFELLKKLDVNTCKIGCMNVCLENETVKYLYNSGVRFFTFDNYSSLVEFSKYANLKNVKILIRLSTTEIFSNKFTHLGANLKETLKMISYLEDKSNQYGISFYIQKDLKSEEKIINKIFNYIKENLSDLGVSFVNIGGVEENIADYENILQNFKEEFKIDNINLEIGRYLVEDTISMKTRIIREKLVNNTKTIIMKNGIYSGFFDLILYNRKFDIYLLVKNKEIKLNYEKESPEDYEFVLCGGAGDSADKIGLMYINSEYKDYLQVGAELCIKNVGAYFEEFFMKYSSDLEKIFI